MTYQFNVSNEEFVKAQSIIPEGIKGMHKIINNGQYPYYFSKGKGAHVWDIDNNKYIDFVMGKGPYILGYCNKNIDAAVIEQIGNGNVFPMGSRLHNQLAELMISVVQSAEKVLFYKTGSCATTAAIRIAKAYNKKGIIYSSGYHGWHEWNGPGVDMVIDFEYNLNVLEELIRKHEDNGCAVIITPEEGYFDKGYYDDLQNICIRNGLLLIFDEVKSGFRVRLGGIQEKYKVDCDLSVFSKAFSNGYALSAVVGKKEVMDHNQFIHTAGTFDTETVPVTAALETVRILKEHNVLPEIERTCRGFVDRLNQVFREHMLDIHVVDGCSNFRFWSRNTGLETLFYTEMAKNGVLFYPYDNSFLSLAHTEEILAKVLSIVDEVAGGILQTFRGNYEEFKLENLFKYPNRKGFLRNYPGPTGRNPIED